MSDYIDKMAYEILRHGGDRETAKGLVERIIKDTKRAAKRGVYDMSRNLWVDAKYFVMAIDAAEVTHE